MNTTISPGSSTVSQGGSDLNGSTSRIQASTSNSNQGTGIETELQAPALSVEELSRVVDAMNEAMTRMERALNFEVDTDTEELVIRITDKATGDLIRQIPSQDTLKLMQHIEDMHNILFEASA